MSCKISKIFSILGMEIQKYDVPVVELIKSRGSSPFKILVATILSARTRDEVTAKASEKLFRKAGSLKSLKKLSLKDIEEAIKGVGFYRTKARYLKLLPEVIEKRFNGKIPETIERLIELPGVGRKTANLVLASAFGKHAICVDTHVHRISNRIGIVDTKTPLETEIALKERIPKRYWNYINYYFVAFGQKICRPISPRCSICPIQEYCARSGVQKSR